MDGEPVSQLFAGDEAVLSMTIRNNDQNVNARKVRIGASIDTKVLLFTMGETDTKYVDVIESGKSADISYKITVANEAANVSLAFFCDSAKALAIILPCTSAAFCCDFEKASAIARAVIS